MTPTFSRVRSRRTRMDLQKEQVVCTAADHRNSTGAPQLGQLTVLRLIGTLDGTNAHVAGGEGLAQGRRKIPLRPRPAAKQVQAKRTVFREGVTGQVRFRQQPESGDAA